MSLPKNWVEKIFARLLVRYGAAWLRLWDGIPMEAVLEDWANELDGMPGACLSFGLENLPVERPPTVAQFRAICHSKPASQQLAVAGPAADPKRVNDVLATLHHPAYRDPKQWARDLKARDVPGGRLTKFQRDAWRTALGEELRVPT